MYISVFAFWVAFGCAHIVTQVEQPHNGYASFHLLQRERRPRHTQMYIYIYIGDPSRQQEFPEIYVKHQNRRLVEL